MLTSRRLLPVIIVFLASLTVPSFEAATEPVVSKMKAVVMHAYADGRCCSRSEPRRNLCSFERTFKGVREI